MGQDAVTVQGVYHLGIRDLARRRCAAVVRSLDGLEYCGRAVRDIELVGRDCRKHGFLPRAIAWKLLKDDGIPVSTIASHFGKTRQGIETGLKRINERLPCDEAAQNLYEKAKRRYESEINTKS